MQTLYNFTTKPSHLTNEEIDRFTNNPGYYTAAWATEQKTLNSTWTPKDAAAFRSAARTERRMQAAQAWHDVIVAHPELFPHRCGMMGSDEWHECLAMRGLSRGMSWSKDLDLAEEYVEARYPVFTHPEDSVDACDEQYLDTDCPHVEAWQKASPRQMLDDEHEQRLAEMRAGRSTGGMPIDRSIVRSEPDSIIPRESSLREKVCDAIKANPGISNTRLKEAVGANVNRVQAVIDDLLTEGLITQRAGKRGTKENRWATPIDPSVE